MAVDPSEVENRTQQIGRSLLADTRRGQGILGRWVGPDLLLRPLMANEQLRVAALRFVDVLPMLGEAPSLSRHVQEYFRAVQLASWPGAVQRLGLSAAGRFPRLTSWLVRTLTLRMAWRFIAGDRVETVEPSLNALHRAGMGFTLDRLGEAVVSDAETRQYQDQYRKLIADLSPVVRAWPDHPLLDGLSGRPAPRLNVSLKVSALCSQANAADPRFAADAIKDLLRPILRDAQRHGAFVTLDMEHYDLKDITLRVFREVLMESDFRAWPDAGIAIQAYLRDAPADLASLVQWARGRATPVMVRLVRGAYWDFEVIQAQQHGWRIPVWTTKGQTDACYEHCLAMLLGAYPYVETAVATHNARSIAVAMALAEKIGLTPGQYETQMLYGMADELKTAVVHQGLRLRVYVPFGDLIPGMAYLVRRLLENTASQSFLRMGLVQGVDLGTLLVPPPPFEPVPPTQDNPVTSNEYIEKGPAFQPDPEANRGEGKPNLSKDKLYQWVRAVNQSEQRMKSFDHGAAKGVVESNMEVFANEPVRRFTDEYERNAFVAAIEGVRGRLGRNYPLVIAGQERRAASSLSSIDPSQPSRVVGVVPDASPDDARDAVAAAAAAFPAWRDTPARQRAEILMRAAALMRARRDELAAWEVFEAGKPWREADADICEAIDFLEYYAREALRLDRGHSFDVPGETNRYFYEPRGVVVVISPWNFPLAILCGMTAAAIAAGNSVVMKPAPQTPVIAAHFARIVHEAGLHPGVLNYLPGGDQAGDALVRDPRTAMIAFTGSVPVGTHISRVAAEVVEGQHHLKHVIAELGGKNAIIVDDDADVDDAVLGTVASAFGYAGQKCSACSRAIVVGDLYEPFLGRLVEAAASARIGPPTDPGVLLGPVIDKEAYERINRVIDEAQLYSRMALRRDVSALGDGFYIGPTIFADVPPDSYLAQNEVFGPVLAVMRARDFSHAIELANSTRYALTGGVYSRSPDHLEAARRRFRVGNLYLNRKITGAIVARQPFGGFKLSGTDAKAGGPDYLIHFVHARHVTENTLRRGFAPEVSSEPSAERGL